MVCTVQKMKTSVLTLTGIIKKILPNAQYHVEIKDIPDWVLCYISGKMSRNHIKPSLEDKVKVEMSPTDATKGRIVHLFK